MSDAERPEVPEVGRPRSFGLRFPSLAAGVAAALLAAGLALSAAAPTGRAATTPGQVSVQAVGTVSVVPDEATATFGVTAQAATPWQAYDRIAAVTQRIRAGLAGLRLPPADVTTSSLSLNPSYTPEGHLTGYNASLLFTVTVTRLALLPTVLQKAVAAGANQVESLSFANADPNAGVAEALAKAALSAHEEAEAIAASLHVALGPVVRASVESAAPPIVFSNSLHLASAVPSQVPLLPVAPGSQTVTAHLTVVYSLR